MRRISAVLLVIVAISLLACRTSETTSEPLSEVGKVRSGNLEIVLLSRQSALKQGKDSVTIEFKDVSDGRLVDVGLLKGSATMPMAGMAPMFGSVDVQPTDTPGRYLATSELSMAGEWRLVIEWSGPAGQGSANFSPMVQ